MKKLFVLITMFLLCAVSILYIDTSVAEPTTLYVHPGESIQVAIDVSNAGDTIYIYNGVYNDYIHIYKDDIKVIGESKDVIITHDNFPNYVVFIHNCKNITLSSVTITSDTINCIHIEEVFRSTITQCDIKSRNGIGIRLGDIGHEIGTPRYNIIDSCSISDSKIGINIEDCPDNTIRKCNIFNNSEFGINMFGDPSNNLIYFNNFYNNTVNVKDSSILNNTWYNLQIKGGNYYDDYEGVDLNNDTIGDESYTVAGGYKVDRYPFIYKDGWKYLPPEKPVATPGFEFLFVICAMILSIIGWKIYGRKYN